MMFGERIVKFAEASSILKVLWKNFNAINSKVDDWCELLRNQ